MPLLLHSPAAAAAGRRVMAATHADTDGIRPRAGRPFAARRAHIAAAGSSGVWQPTTAAQVFYGTMGAVGLGGLNVLVCVPSRLLCNWNG